jgi:putative transposase
MAKAAVLERQRAVTRYRRGESATAICQSVGHSREWLYKWVRRHQAGGPAWAEERSRRPPPSPRQLGAPLETAIVTTRRSLQQRELFCGAQAIAWELAELGLTPPSLRTIHRVLERHGLVTRGPGAYTPTGTAYPTVPAERPGQVHQTDFVGPCFLRGAGRFYSLHSVDVATGRCGVQQLPTRSSQPTLDAIWAIWQRLGIPQHQQVDNEMVFFGSRTHPRGLGPLIRLCLAMDVEPWFIPPAEPWRNGVVENSTTGGGNLARCGPPWPRAPRSTAPTTPLRIDTMRTIAIANWVAARRMRPWPPVRCPYAFPPSQTRPSTHSPSPRPGATTRFAS